jgi:hypothetical protein
VGARCRSDSTDGYAVANINTNRYTDICANDTTDSDLNNGTCRNLNRNLDPGTGSNRNANRHPATIRNANRHCATDRNVNHYTAIDRNAGSNTYANGDSNRCANTGGDGYVLALGLIVVHDPLLPNFDDWQ